MDTTNDNKKTHPVMNPQHIDAAKQAAIDARRAEHDAAMERCHLNVEAAKADKSGKVYRY